MGRGSGGVRAGKSGSNPTGSETRNATNAPRALSDIKKLNAQETAQSLKRSDELVKAIVDAGGHASDGWKIVAELERRNTAFQLLGRDANTENAKEVINDLTIDRSSAKMLSVGEIITDGTSLYTVARENKDGSIVATRTDYDVTHRSNGKVLKPITDSIRLGKNDVVTRFKGIAAYKFRDLVDSHIYKLKREL